MNTLTKKIDFAVVLTVNHANPNGDPVNGNRPRTGYDCIGEISDVCLKRKIRNRLQQSGEKIFVQSDDQRDDGKKSLSERYSAFETQNKFKDEEEKKAAICREWIDVRTFGQLFAFKSKGNDKGVSYAIRGPMSVMPAFSVDPVSSTTTHITKSVNSEEKETRDSSTMGAKHRVDFGMYVTYGSINCELASKTGFSDEDAEKIKEALRTMFRNDASSARPEGSMEVVKLIWWEHNCKNGQYSSAKVHRSLKIKKLTEEAGKSAADYAIEVESPADLKVEILDGE